MFLLTSGGTYIYRGPTPCEKALQNNPRIQNIFHVEDVTTLGMQYENEFCVEFLTQRNGRTRIRQNGSQEHQNFM